MCYQLKNMCVRVLVQVIGTVCHHPRGAGPRQLQDGGWLPQVCYRSGTARFHPYAWAWGGNDHGLGMVTGMGMGWSYASLLTARPTAPDMACTRS